MTGRSRTRLRPIVALRLDGLNGGGCLAIRRRLGLLLDGRRGLAAWRRGGGLCLGAAGLFLVAATDK